MKAEVRVLAWDDGPFARGDARVPVVGVVMRGAAYVEAVLTTDVAVDGDDATAQLEAAIARSRYRTQISAIFVDGIAFGGFNVVNLERLSAATGVPAVSVTRGGPDLAAMRAALEKAFADGGVRWALIERQRPRPIATETNPVCIHPVGISFEEATRLVALTTARGLTPEPLRLAHLIATAIVRGESRGT